MKQLSRKTFSNKSLEEAILNFSFRGSMLKEEESTFHENDFFRQIHQGCLDWSEDLFSTQNRYYLREHKLFLNLPEKKNDFSLIKDPNQELKQPKNSEKKSNKLKFEITKENELKSKKKRFDYEKKKFKKNLLDYYITQLNICLHKNQITKHDYEQKKLKFYVLDYKGFTANINYNKNRNWLNNYMKDILIEFGQKNKNSNAKTIKSLEELGLIKGDIKLLLNLTYEELIIRYLNSQQIQKYIKNHFPFWELYDKNNENSFLNVIQNRKGHQIVEKKNKIV